ncbi:hypothetical protein ACS24H_27265, partial [Bacillus cereus group sp. BC3]|uniref:hypothetical protein n=1 Tax=Bacillus cereus group sp. BC3 TaxID=3445323 RepID=UPI003F27CDA7
MKNQTFLSKNYGFFVLAVILYWLKTYIAYQLEFKLGIENLMQQILLFINPL